MAESRLLRLAGADPGFFVLGLHARAEALLREQLASVPSRDAKFHHLVHDWFNQKRQEGVSEPRSQLRQRLIDDHQASNQVRHEYVELDPEEARASAHLFWELVTFAGLQGRAEFLGIPRLFADWSDNPWTSVESVRIDQLHREIANLRSKANAQLAEYDHLKEREALAVRLEAEVAASQAKVKWLEIQTKTKDEKYDQKRQELDAQRREVKRLQAEASENAQQLVHLADLRAYLDRLSRLTNLTRTRRAFEDQVLRLTPEQRALAERLPLDRETLIRGSAGTGKSLVLLKLLQRIVQPPSDALDFGSPRSSVLLLTYTKALTKYGAYLTGLLGLNVEASLVRTADSVVFELAQKVLRLKVEFEWASVPAVRPWVAASGLNEAELVAEAELLDWGWNLGLDEYLAFERTGFRHPLRNAERRVVWDCLKTIEAELARLGVVPAVLAARELAARASEWEALRVDYVLLDEAQDLAPVRLRFFRALARKGFGLGADDGQILYQSRSPFVRAGLDLAGGRTRVLRTNFRNTVAIEKAALRFYDGPASPGAFRTGPEPEFVFLDRGAALLDQVMAHLNILTEEFGYAPENILLVHSGSKSGLEARLKEAGLAYQSVIDPSFQFETTGAVRLTTFQSAKGLDSPVVLVLWSMVFSPPGWSAEAVERQQRNLLYVALTRALEQVRVFARDDGGPCVEAMKRISEASASGLSHGGPDATRGEAPR